MAGTVTWVGLDVHARSTHGAAVDLLTGELSRARFGSGYDAVIGWLKQLPGPVRAVYEAGPLGCLQLGPPVPALGALGP